MRHIAQGLNECAPTTIAMLAEAPVEEVKERIETKLGTRFPDVFIYCNAQQLDEAFTEVARGYGLANMRFRLLGGWPTGEPIDPMALDLTGKGSCLVFEKNNLKLHIVAYEDGVIYDGDQPQPHPIEVYPHRYLIYQVNKEK